MALENPTDNKAKIVKLIPEYADKIEAARTRIEGLFAAVDGVVSGLETLNTSYADRIAALTAGSEKEADYNELNQERQELVLGTKALLARLVPDVTQDEINTILGI